MSKVAAALALVFAFVSCPVHAYKLTPQATAMRVPSSSVPGNRIDVLVLDNREEVLEGDKREDYEGVSREFYGVPVPRATNDGSTMAAYLGERLRIGFERAGYASAFIPSGKGARPEDRIASLDMGQARAFVVDMRDWHYDFGGFKPSFYYDVTVLVFDRDHHLLASKDFKGEDFMPTGGLKYFKTRFAELYQTVFDRIFATEEIHRALQDQASVADPAAPATEVPAAPASPAASGQ